MSPLPQYEVVEWRGIYKVIEYAKIQTGWRFEDGAAATSVCQRLNAAAKSAAEANAAREAAERCDHDGAFDLVTTHGGGDDLCETPWSWCPKCGTLWDGGVQRDPEYIKAGLTPAQEEGTR